MPGFLSSRERQNQIFMLLQRNQRLNIQDICAAFGVSEATARRDLESLAAEGKLQRVHGGAIPPTQALPEAPVLQRQDAQAHEKIRIGQAAAALVQDGETVFLGSGTTVLELARRLQARRNLVVITNSLPVLNTLAGAEGLTVVGLGGMLRHSELSFIGHLTEQSLGEVRAGKIIIGTPAISLEHGLTHDYLPETTTDRAILQSGTELFVLADHTKFGRTASFRLAPLERVHTIVTGRETPPNFLECMQAAGIRVIVA